MESLGLLCKQLIDLETIEVKSSEEDGGRSSIEQKDTAEMDKN